MGRRGKTIFLTLIALYLLVHSLRENAFPLPAFFRDHFTDLLYLPMLLLCCLWLTRTLKREAHWFVPASYVLVIIGLNIFLFEYYLPHSRSGFTADPLDCLMYTLGGGIFLLFQRKLLG